VGTVFQRIAPIWLIAKEGWLFSTKEEMEKNEGKLEEQACVDCLSSQFPSAIGY